MELVSEGIPQKPILEMLYNNKTTISGLMFMLLSFKYHFLGVEANIQQVHYCLAGIHGDISLFGIVHFLSKQYH